MKRAIIKILPGLLILLFSSCITNNKEEKDSASQNTIELTDEFVIMAYSGPPIEEVNEKRFYEIADAGIDVLVPGNGTFTGEQNLKAMDLALKAGIRILPVDMRILPFALKPEVSIDTLIINSIVNEYSKHPAFAGYLIKDEPGAELFASLRNLRDIFQERDPKHEPFINLLPSYGSPTQLGAADFREYIHSFIDTVKPALLSYDYYALRNGVTMYEGWFNDLKIVREETQKAQIPFIVFVQSEGITEGLRVPNRAEILWQVNTALAYGAKGFGWFCYWTPPSDQGFPQTEGAKAPIIESHYNAMIDVNGNRTEVYDYVREANLFSKKVGNGLLDWENTDVALYNKGKMMEGGSSPIITPIGKKAKLVIGTFRKDDKIRIIVSNSSCEEISPVALNVSSGWKMYKVFASIEAEVTDNKKSQLEWNIQPGGSVVIDLQKIITQETEKEVRDFTWFLKRLRTVDHLPIIENSHTAMVSTWDKEGANDDHWTHDNIEENTNTIVDIDGPGCIHRIFTGLIDERFDNTRIQIYVDHNEKPLFDMPITKFFDDKYSPIPYPLVFVKTYPGILMPIPFEKNIKIKIVNNLYNTKEWIKGMWGVYWQFTYTKYDNDVQVQSLSWPLNADEENELNKTCEAWLNAESTDPTVPERWTMQRKSDLKPGESLELNLKNSGIIKQMRIAAWPDTPEILNNLRLKIYWDGNDLPSVDIPLGYMFGHGQVGHNKELSSAAAVMGKWPKGGEFPKTEPEDYNTNYNSLLLGMNNKEVYSMFPMPFSKGARLELVNTGDMIAEQVEIKLDVEKMKTIPEDWGRFHVTWSQSLAATDASPKYGPQDISCKVFLNRRAKGKYVGSMLQVDWDKDIWWGEGDWLFWTDEDEWPPSYHGTGSEEYFNSGWGMFDRKAVSGFVSLRPGYPTVYSFHLNDAFCFQKNITVVQEQEALPFDMADFNPMWSSTAFWYSETPVSAESMQ